MFCNKEEKKKLFSAIHVQTNTNTDVTNIQCESLSHPRSPTVTNNLLQSYACCLLGTFQGHQSNDHLSDKYGCSALFVRTACFPIMRYRVNVAVNCVCAWQAVHT